MNCHDASRMLNAYIDNEVPAGDAVSIAEHIQGCAECRERLMALESLGRLVRGIPYRTAPARLRTTIATAAPQRARSILPMYTWAAAAVLVLAVGGGAAYRAMQARQTAALAEGAINAHVSALMRDRLFDVRSSNEHTVKPWFQGKVDFSPPVPDLSSMGFPLIGGRLDTIDGRRVAALVYQRREHIISVFVWPTRGRQAANDLRTARGFNERHWDHADLSLWAVSDLNAPELGEFVKDFEAAASAP
jgi:anti-sigma factor RsiW